MANLTYDEVMEAISDYASESYADGVHDVGYGSIETEKSLEKLKKIIRQLVDNQQT
jgi:hypothetical protein